MTRIEKIHHMTDEELAEFLSKIAGMNGNNDMLVDVPTVRDMTDVEFAVYLSDLDDSDHLSMCTGACPSDDIDRRSPCDGCMMDWLRREGPLMDGEG